MLPTTTDLWQSAAARKEHTNPLLAQLKHFVKPFVADSLGRFISQAVVVVILASIDPSILLIHHEALSLCLFA